MPIGFEGAVGNEGLFATIRQQIADRMAQQAQTHAMSVEDQKLQIEKDRFAQEAADRALLRQQQGAAFNEKIAEGTAANMGPGQSVISPELAARFQNTTLAPLVKTDQTLPSTQIAAGASLPGSDGSQTAPAVKEQPSVLTGQMRFMGTPAANAAENKRVLAGQLVSSLPKGSNERLSLQYQQATGLNPPAGVFDKPANPGEIKDTSNGLVRVAPDNSVTPLGVQGYHPPKDTSSADSNRLDRSYQFNSSQLEKVRSPISTKMDRLSGLNDALTQATPASDALVAPEILSIAAGGQGSGLRMNEAEISRIVGGRSVWENLKASLQKFSTDPAHANSLTPDQRNQIRQIMTASQTRGQQKIKAISAAEQALVDANDVTGHRQVLRDLQQKLDAIDGAGSSATTAEDLIKKYGGGQ